jgi:tetratricopeptide (TPR) repeat protein
MSSFVHGSGSSYGAYLQAKQFVDDICWEISESNLNLIATREAIEAHGLRLEATVEAEGDRLAGVIQDEMTGLRRTIHADFGSIKETLDCLCATFDWGIAHLESAIGGLNDSIRNLIVIAQTPERTWAYEQFDIAREAFRRGLYPEALEHIERAIEGSAQHPGYRLEHRFHHLRAIIRRGDYKNSSPEIVNLRKAEDAYVLAARYAGADHAPDAAAALCGAGWVAYGQGEFDRSEAHLRGSLSRIPTGEGHFILAKVLIHKGLVQPAIQALAAAIEVDPLYAFRALDDGDFLAHESLVRKGIDEQRRLFIQRVQHFCANNLWMASAGQLLTYLDGLLRTLGSAALENPFYRDDVGRKTDLLGASAAGLAKSVVSLRSASAETPLVDAADALRKTGELLRIARELRDSSLGVVNRWQQLTDISIDVGNREARRIEDEVRGWKPSGSRESMLDTAKQYRLSVARAQTLAPMLKEARRTITHAQLPDA